MNLQIVIKTFAENHNIIAGICDTSSLNPERYISAMNKTPFVSQNIKKRTDPEEIFPYAKSIIAIGVGQDIPQLPNNPVQNFVTPLGKGGAPPSQANNLTGGVMAQLSSLGVDHDYHIRVKAILKKLAGHLAESHENLKFKILVDSPNLDERAFAHRAGIGFFGRNGLIISEKFGTRFNIGLLLTNIPLNSTEETQKEKIFQGCPEDCRLCIDACPGNALQHLEQNGINPDVCISYLTQKQENLTEKEKSLIGNQLYGCDICQDVCPFNKIENGVQINPQEWLISSYEALHEKYAHTAMMWRGTEILRRNAKIVMNNLGPTAHTITNNREC